jgi:hypothetical protein
MRIRWTKPTESGLADRLNDLLLVGTYARCLGAQLLMEWPAFPAKSIDVAHRRQDILLDNIRAHINLPREFVFNPRLRADSTFDFYIGGCGDKNAFYVQHLKDTCSQEQFNVIFDSVARDFTFCPEITSFLDALPEKFVSFHIRRGDKVRPPETGMHDNTYVHTTEIEWLDSITYKAIDRYLRLGYTTFFVCGDEDEKTAPFVQYIESKGGAVIRLPDLPKWKTTYYDLAVMTRSDFNVTSQRYSSFSRFPSQIGKGTFVSVVGLEAEGLL